MKYDGIVIYSDLDGTLLDDSRHLSDENLQAIRTFIDQGGSFGVATGRSELTVPLNFPDLPMNIPSIFYNGAHIFDTRTREDIYSTYLPAGMEPVFQDILDRYPHSSVEINVGGKACVLRYNELIHAQIAREGLTDVKARWDEIPGNWYKVLVADERETLKLIRNDLDGLKRTDIQVVFSEKDLLDILSSDASKGRALLHQKNANRDRWRLVFAIGDNDNDREMILAADVGIAVSNATRGVKEAARYEIAHHNTPCIPQVLEIIDRYL